jgi:acetolactate synthase-1/2/3 large subunit
MASDPIGELRTGMNGALAFWRTAAAAGVRFCFANPGTTELSLVAAMQDVPEIRPVLCLFEGVALGAADGYGRMSGRPAVTLSHLGPGFGNAIANCHNARRARSPVVNVIGNQPTWHLGHDTPLTTDIESLARVVSDWVRVSQSATALPHDLAEALAVATAGRVATLIVPADCQWGEAREIATSRAPDPARFDDQLAAAAAQRLGRGSAILLGGEGLRERGLRAAARVAAATGATLLCESFPARLDGGAGAPPLRRFPYLPDLAAAMLRATDHLLLAGAASPVSYFGHEGGQSSLVPAGVEVASLCEPTDDVAGALEALADRFDPVRPPAVVATPSPPVGGALSGIAVASVLASVQPEGAVIVDEGVSIAGAYLTVGAAAPAHAYLGLTGGATGMGLSCAIGAALACPDRRVFVIEGDGSALYAPQALWTQARVGARVTNLIYSNAGYRILELELRRKQQPSAPALTDFSNPAIDWLALSASLGVPAARVHTAEALREELLRSLSIDGPTLIEVKP